MYFGDPSIVPVKLARMKAKEILARVALGEDLWVRREKARREIQERKTLREVADAWTQDRETRGAWREETVRSVRHALKLLLERLGDRGLEELSRQDLKAVHREMAGRPVMANRVIHWTRALYSWAIRQELTERNPALGIETYPEQPRERVMSREEWQRFWRAVTGMKQPWRGLFRVLALTGCRQSELWGLRWDQVGPDGIQLSARRTKGKRGRVVVLAGPARAEIEALRQLYGATPFVFGEGLKREAMRWRWEQLLKAATLENLAPHDLRRSKASYSLNLGIPGEVVAASIGDSKEVSSRVYAHVAAQTLRDAEERVQRALVTEAESEPAEVVELRR